MANKNESNEEKTKLMRDQLHILEGKKKDLEDIIKVMEESITKHNKKINEAITKEEKRELIFRLKKIIMNIGDMSKKKEKYETDIDDIKKSLNHSTDINNLNHNTNVNGDGRIFNVTNTIGYTEKEYNELMALIDSVPSGKPGVIK